MNKRLTVFQDLETLALEAAEFVSNVARAAADGRGWFNWVLSGGGTPEPLYRRLARSPFRQSFPWTRTRVFWGDERCVPPSAAGSNYGQAYRLLLEHVPIPEDNIFRIKGELTPAKAAQDYEVRLATLGEGGRRWPVFDLVLLGMGSDGHTASLFPGPVDKREKVRPVMPVTARYGDRPADRVTLTPVAFNDARHILFLVSGSSKAEAVATVIEGDGDPERWPACRIQPQAGSVTWLLDRAAADRLRRLNIGE